ncbi:hypothetical protein AV530_014454 [Patagioenas fasciata monilis]|uniref:Uncharacterized protein n=1 Tax=Patagioenas fasciata monilis TaxID=372326 RepID=A0A1V4KBR9_PATFA|nr:hypothetical protein AV530_014454 [Patagioenas fasciata monilis]
MNVGMGSGSVSRYPSRAPELNLIPLRFLQGLVFLSLSFSLGILLGNNHREKLFTANWHLLCVDSPPFTEISALARA